MSRLTFDGRAKECGIGPILCLGDVPPLGHTARFDEYSIAHRDAITGFVDHIINKVAVPREISGRSGPVCPFTPRAIANETIYLAVAMSSMPSGTELQRIADFMRDVFPLLPPEEQSLEHLHAAHLVKCMFVLFPDMGEMAGEAISQVQRASKLEFMARGYMAGELFPNCPLEGLYNRDFRPFDVPVPALGIRHMTEQDIPFCLSDERYITAYLGRFGAAGYARAQSFLARMPSEADRNRIAQVMQGFKNEKFKR